MRPTSSAQQRPTSSAQQRPVSRRKRLDDLKTKEPVNQQGSVEELNIRVASRTTTAAPKSILDTLRESVVSRGPDQKIDIKDTLKRPLTGLFRRTKHSQNQPPPPPQQQFSQSQIEQEQDVNAQQDQFQNSLKLDENASVLNLNANTETMGMESMDFSMVDFGKFEDIDVSCLARLICVQDEITDEEEPWTWETLFASVSSEMREAWSQQEDDEDGVQPVSALNVLNASVVVFHAHDINKEHRLPMPTSSKQKFVFMSQEAAPSLDKESKGKWWKSVINFHWIIGYMTKAHIKMPYGGVFVDPATGRERNFQPIGNFNKEQVLSSKNIKGASWLVSNCESKERMNVALALKQHFHVDIGGKCSPDNKDLCPRGRDCNPLISQYYFYLAFENENCVDYVTEKMVDLLSLSVVPIVMKRSVYQNIFPPEAFVAVDDFSSVQKLADHLRFLIDNPDEYFKLIAWRNEWTRAGWNSRWLFAWSLCVVQKTPSRRRYYCAAN
ncbi:Fucosyl transferase [Aphelenchoides bicaudatus]|nr:Fucosyl transferase [Aphelenchoides bicaudatus]